MFDKGHKGMLEFSCGRDRERSLGKLGAWWICENFPVRTFDLGLGALEGWGLRELVAWEIGTLGSSVLGNGTLEINVFGRLGP